MKKYEEFLKCDYSADEITDMAKDLARSNQTRASLEQQKKQVDSQLKAQIEEQNSIIGRLSSAIATGCEWRNVECRVELDTPEKGRKTIVRLDTGEEVAVKFMTDEDRQMVLDLKSKAEAEEEKQNPPAEPIITPPPFVPRLDEPGVVDADTEPRLHIVIDTATGAPLAQAAVMGGTHQRKQRKPRDAKAEAAADGSGDELD